MIAILYKTENRKNASELANSLLKARLSNSIDQLPTVKSFSFNNGQIEEHEEVLLIIKTKALLYSQVENKIKEITKSDNPKMYSLPMTQIDERYRDLLRTGVIEV
ncbi:divalent cation tolerance protein CutA [Fulvivirga sp. RKSG066]|uniref:divalent cation tolerance protein CutA n=1 Tax=Fulvivirga aurantia TaxID=2529383 RepID=UPI0012BCB327|nr:divalent cation tolerance protein CutA [Fulvivirga aurantia]MTI22798.1 divalent cation tolerance protein CutA [Fulvivirga aurantia]